jgi:hypothetical protein
MNEQMFIEKILARVDEVPSNAAFTAIRLGFPFGFSRVICF